MDGSTPWKPEGYMILSAVPVVISAIISWVICIAGYIYMIKVEPFLSQQVLFSFVAAVGIATMHFTGKFRFITPNSLRKLTPTGLLAATCYSRVPPSNLDT